MTRTDKNEATTVASDEYFACLYSDGSISVASRGSLLEGMREQALFDDQNERDPAHFTKVVRVRLEVLETLEVPSAAASVGRDVCQTCGRPHVAPAIGGNRD